MKTYHVLVAEPKPGHGLVTKLVDDDVFHGDGEGKPENFFVEGTFESVEDKGTFDVENLVAMSMADEYIEVEY